LDEPTQPLASTGSDLFTTNPRAASSPIGFFLSPSNVAVLVALYFASIPALRWLCENYPLSAKEQEAAWAKLHGGIKASRTKKLKSAKTDAERKRAERNLADLGDFGQFKLTAIRGFNGSASTAFKYLAALHNLVLIVFSATVFLKATPLVFSWGREHGFLAAYCDKDKSMWNDGGFGYWATVFYLSKYYEFVDTWLIVCKTDGRTGRRAAPSLLQTYHHAGIALTMYGATISQGAWIAWVVVMNSAVHAIMYTYFLAATFGYRSPLARYLTGLQLA